jgi:regulatory protein
MLSSMDDTSNPPKKTPRLGSASRQTDQAMARAMAKAGKAPKKLRSEGSSFGSKRARSSQEEREGVDPEKTSSSGRVRAAPRERPAPKPRDGSELEGLPEEEAYKRFFSYAGRLLAIKDWSEAGLAERLAERFKKYPQAAELAARASARMREIGGLDDARFARGFIRQRLGRKSVMQATRELTQKGISREVAAEAVDALRDEGLIEDPADQAYLVWSKKFGALPTDDKSRAKQARFMASRGFSYDALSKAWARAKRGDDD